MKKKIILISGDPNSINSEIIYKCWKKIPKNQKNKIILLSNYNLIQQQFKKLNYNIKTVLIDNINFKKNTDKLKIINIDLKFKKPFQVSKKQSSKFVLNSLNLAHNLALKKNVAGVINCPIDKKHLIKEQTGVTEFLAKKCSVKKDSEVMVIKNKDLAISPLTTHLDLKYVSKKINKKLIVKKLMILNNWFIKSYKKKPNIALLGLNPHNAELRKNSEEKKIIIPAIKELKKFGIIIKGPFASDTLFINDYKKFDIIVGMYHDQILTPFKSIFKFDAINLTLGLKYLRVSPDHGVAKDRVLKKNSDPTSLLRCIEYLNNFS